MTVVTFILHYCILGLKYSVSYHNQFTTFSWQYFVDMHVLSFIVKISTQLMKL